MKAMSQSTNLLVEMKSAGEGGWVDGWVRVRVRMKFRFRVRVYAYGLEKDFRMRKGKVSVCEGENRHMVT